MASLPVILDISSDDDEPCCHEPEGEDYDWLSEVLNSVEKMPEDDSDDVVVVSEVNHRKRAKFPKPVEKEFDEDCVILDGDPEKSDGVVNEPETESDELLIVGEKGQVACRDFPHSRQHCAKFAFNSTPPERHCNLCHCYVCDSIAPCKYWGKGNSIYDHCHATEKEERWKLQRENRKKRKRSDSKLPYTSHSMSQPQLNQCNPVVRSTSNPVIQSQVSRQTVIRACASSTSNPVIQNQVSNPATKFGTPRVRSHAKGYMGQHILGRNRNPHHLTSQQPVHPISNDFMRKERDHSIGDPGARYHQRSLSGHGSSYSINHAHGSQQSRARSQPSTLYPQSGTSQLINNRRELTFSASQIQQQAPGDYFPLPSAVPESSSQLQGSSDQTLPDFDFEKWLLDNDPLQDGLGDIDAGMLDSDFKKWVLGNHPVYD